jgi:uncharacterized protein
VQNVASARSMAWARYLMLRRVNPSAEARAFAGDRALPTGSMKTQRLPASAVAVIVRPWFALNVPGCARLSTEQESSRKRNSDREGLATVSRQLKVVFDTNIYVSAFILPGSQADSALMRIVEGTNRLIISKAIVDELLDALSRKFAKDADELARLAVFLADLADIVRPRGRIEVLNNRILECAKTGGAHAIVTGDREMLRLRRFEEIRIISLRQHLEGNQSA